jgi:hypothetical protein
VIVGFGTDVAALQHPRKPCEKAFHIRTSLIISYLQSRLFWGKNQSDQIGLELSRSTQSTLESGGFAVGLAPGLAGIPFVCLNPRHAGGFYFFWHVQGFPADA